MRTLEGLDRDLTILMIAHRLSTLRGCDMIVELHDGHVGNVGTYDELMQRSVEFRNLVHKGESGQDGAAQAPAHGTETDHR